MDNFADVCDMMSKRFSDMSDFTVRRFSAGNTRYAVMCFQNFSSRELVNRYIVSPLVSSDGERGIEDVVASVSLSSLKDADDAETRLLMGACVIFSDKKEMFYAMTNSEDGRSPSEPETENVIRGAHEGFTENGGFNAMLIRRRIRSPHLKKRDIVIGERTKTTVSVMYLDNVIKQSVLDELMARIEAIKIDGVIDSGYVEQYIQDGKNSVYPTVGNSERPDKVAAKILEGRAAVIVDGSPVVLTAPYLFIEGFQVTEDYAKSAYFATFERALRFFGMMISLFLPAFLIALSKSPSLFGGRLEKWMETVRSNSGISLFFEMTAVFLIFELVREVGLRMPKAVGSAVGLVGSLIIGDSAVEAGIISAPVLIAVAFSAVCNFLAPPYMNSNVIYRAFLILCSGIFGFAGFFFSVVISVMLFISKKSFGVPYLYPLLPPDKRGLSDFILMLPIARRRYLPRSISGKKEVRSQKRKDSEDE